MNLSSRLPAAMLAAAFFSTSALAVDDGDFNYRSTEDLYQICSAPEDPASASPAAFACRAFIAATVQYHDAVSDRKRLKRLVCYPKSATIADGRKAFLAWGARNAGNAERMNEVPVMGLMRALAEAYPCK
jgi:hypothetical protein